MEKIKAASEIFDAIMSLIFIVGGMIIWGVGIWKEDHNRKIYGMILVIAAFTVWKH